MLWRHLVVTAAAAWLCVSAAADAAESKANRAPIVTGTIPNSSVGADYFFRPEAKDPEGDALTFILTGAPTWMVFRASDGRIVGRPPEAAVYHNIVLSVRDSAGNTTSLPPATVTITTGPATSCVVLITVTPAFPPIVRRSDNRMVAPPVVVDRSVRVLAVLSNTE